MYYFGFKCLAPCKRFNGARYGYDAVAAVGAFQPVFMRNAYM